MKFLIIGSKGFIGSHCLQIFSKLHQVWGADVVTDYVATNYYQVDAINADFKSIFEDQHFDICINCSGAASVPRSFKEPTTDFSLNVFNVVKILEAIRVIQPACKFINLSSAAVYGNPQNLPITESTECRPLSPYGYHKLMAEMAVKEYATLFGSNGISARLFSVYGPGLQKQLFWDWHLKIQAHGHLTVLGTGLESRDFLYVSDLANSLLQLAEKAVFDGSAINISGGRQWYIREVIALFQQHYFQSFSYSFSEVVRTGDPINWHADVSRMKALGYQPQVTLEEGLKIYFEWLGKEKK